MSVELAERRLMEALVAELARAMAERPTERAGGRGGHSSVPATRPARSRRTRLAVR